MSTLRARAMSATQNVDDRADIVDAVLAQVEPLIRRLAEDVLDIADDLGFPHSQWQSDPRMIRASVVLGE
jgi:hypothetical protein